MERTPPNVQPDEVVRTDPVAAKDITGHFIGIHPNGSLVTAQMPNGQFFAIIFSTVEKLREILPKIGVTEFTVKTIDDKQIFVNDTLSQGFRIMCDPYFVTAENGSTSTRWTEIY